MGYEPVELHVRDGNLTDSGSWVCLWMFEGQVIYVGATGLPPEVRTWLHLHDPDPEIGRLKARYPGIGTDSLDVIAFPLPESVPRSHAKAAAIDRLGAAGLLSEHYVGDPPRHEPVGDELSPLLALITGRIIRSETG
jgi:hypothetical protein